MLAVVYLGGSAGCGQSGRDSQFTKKETATKSLASNGDLMVRTDYSDKNNWLSLPLYQDKQVDIFYVYPTAWGMPEGSTSVVSTIDNEKMRRTAAGNFETQATAFQPVGNIFAPFYRQLDAGFILSKSPLVERAYIGVTPYADIEDSFDYYIKHYNHGRPFILAGHSQGSMVLKELLMVYMKEHPDVQERMVAAYLLGFSVTGEDMQRNHHLKYAEGPDDTGVIISFNTEAPDLTVENKTVLKGALTINPITWTRSETPAGAYLSKGSRIRDGEDYTDIFQFADATVNQERGTVMCSTVRPQDFKSGSSDLFPLGVYHAYDYQFYYYDIRENARNRVEHYFQNAEADK
ncbi:DUF3089 domain-containing protein [Diplocloster agilis]|uniref:DUF3089 domain-containing protein n=1 Tax=Diplocloster agilis TaxID=2850323 RepID=A0A949JY92_9FIRM|nr:DUF3089 domain-containing protein [Diplocloster agilis]MBU9735957.1 DUF3089 domain-containing protein [Diplocloster agilis]